MLFFHDFLDLTNERKYGVHMINIFTQSKQAVFASV